MSEESFERRARSRQRERRGAGLGSNRGAYDEVKNAAGVQELRLVVTTSDYDEAVHFYRDVLGLREQATFASAGGRLTILEAGRATPVGVLLQNECGCGRSCL